MAPDKIVAARYARCCACVFSQWRGTWLAWHCRGTRREAPRSSRRSGAVASTAIARSICREGRPSELWGTTGRHREEMARPSSIMSLCGGVRRVIGELVRVMTIVPVVHVLGDEASFAYVRRPSAACAAVRPEM